MSPSTKPRGPTTSPRATHGATSPEPISSDRGKIITTVNISGTWSEKQRPNNGLERVAEHIHGNRITRVPVVGYIEFHSYTEKRTGNVLTVAIPAIEAGVEADGSDPTGAGAQLWQILDQLRKAHGKGNVEDDLFSVPRESFDYGDDDQGAAEELDGQQEIRLGPDGEHEVPPPSAEELMAERAEQAEAEQVQGEEPTAEAPTEEAPEPEPKKAKRGRAAPSADPFTPDAGDVA